MIVVLSMIRFVKELRGQAKKAVTMGSNTLVFLHGLILLYRLSRSNLIFEPKNKLNVYSTDSEPP